MNKNYLNDSPIETSSDDIYGVLPFAKSLASSILNIENPLGTTIALNGEWGAGKSSVVNLVREELNKENEGNLVLSEFTCWWFRGEEALALAFLQNLNSLVRDKLGDKAKDLVPKLGKTLLQAGPVVGAAMSLTPAGLFAGITGASMSFAERFFNEADTLERTFNQLAEALDKQEQRFLIIIDDIDRLSPDEALAIFRIVKSVGRLPNLMYLLVFDRALAEKAVSERFPSEGPHFLEKIIQASFEPPRPLRTDLNHSILAAIEDCCGSPNKEQMTRTLNLFHDIVAPYLETPRHVKRFQSAISVTWPAIADEINLADFIALETIRLYEPSVFKAIGLNKASVCGLSDRQNGSRRDLEDQFSPFLKGISEERHDLVRTALMRLFPRLENTGYSGSFRPIWDAERRVCIENHFDTYFRLSLAEEALSIRSISDLIENAGDPDFVSELFLNAASERRRNGTSMVPVWLDELNSHAHKIDRNLVEPLLASLFEIHDRIDLEIDDDRGFMGVGTTSLRYHWFIRRLINDRFSLDERTKVYQSALRNASLGWLVDFARSAAADYKESENGPTREHDCLIRQDAVEDIRERALEAIRSAANDMSLIKHRDLISILYSWRHFQNGDATEIRGWTDKLLDDDEALVILAQELTGESWSHGMGWDGLGDRVAERHIRAQISDDVDILDVAQFRTSLERLQSSGTLGQENQQIVDQFLAAWDQRENGEDRY